MPTKSIYSEETLRAILNASRDRVLLLDRAGTIVALNKTAAAALGKQMNDLLGANAFDFFPREITKKRKSYHKEVFESGRPARYEDIREGIRLDTTAHPIFDEKGNVRLVVVFSRDMTEFKKMEKEFKTYKNEFEDLFWERSAKLMDANEKLLMEIEERKKVEQALRKSEKRYREIYESSRDGYAVVDMEGKFLEFNTTFQKMLGFPREDLSNKEYEDLTPEKWHALEAAIMENQVLKRGYSDVYEKEYQRADGSILPIEIRTHLMKDENGNPSGMWAFVRDITESKVTEEQIKDEKKRLESLIKYSSLGIVTLDENHIVLSCNRTFEQLFQYEASEIIGKHIDSIIAKDEKTADAKSYTERVLKGEAIHGTGRRYRKDGTLIDVEIFGVPVIVDEKIKGIYGIYHDISALKEAEKALRESEERYRTYFEQDLSGAYISRPDGCLIACNPAFARIFGFSSVEEALETNLEDIYIPSCPRSLFLDKLAHEGKIEGFETRMCRKDGTPIHIIENTLGIFDENGKLVEIKGVLMDATEKKALEKQLHHALKMEAIGTLAGGIAHDFNNLLMGIQGNASLMLLELDADHPHYEKLKNIEQYVQNGAFLTKQLLGFARGGKYEVQPTNLNDLVDRSATMFGRTKKEIIVHCKLQKDLWIAEVDQGQIEQVLLNLYVNAWQAMPGGGEMFLQTDNLLVGEKASKLLGLDPGRYVKISVTDTGVGMDEATQQRAFDPFFTTKEIGRGTGLGLASAYGILKSHAGIIHVTSAKGEGSTFDIYLPTSKKQPKFMKEPAEDIISGSGTVLLVDDEDMIIDVGERMLKKLGYDVITAKSGREAIEVYERHRDRIDLVILDMIMPDMGGGETYGRLREIDPHITVLLSSGYSADGQALDIMKQGNNSFIQKPFKISQLSREVHGILAKKA